MRRGPEHLVPLADLAFRQQAAILGELSDRLARLKEEAGETRKRAGQSGAEDAATLARAGLLQRWREQRLARIEQERATLEAFRAERLSETRRAFGRLVALQALVRETRMPGPRN